MNTIHVTLPLNLEQMKSVITTVGPTVIIDYHNSVLKGRGALIYLTNANIPNAVFDVSQCDKETVYDLIDAYITQKSIVPVRGLIDSVMQLLYVARGIVPNGDDQQSIDTTSLVKRDEFEAYVSNERRHINFSKLIHVLDNIPLFALTCHTGFKDAVGDGATAFPSIDDVDYTGLTFVNLLEVDSFVTYYFSVPTTTQPVYFTQQFDEYMFSGKNLFSYVSNTMIFATLSGFLSGELSVDQLEAAYAEQPN